MTGLAALGDFCARHARWVVAAWLVALVLALLAARFVPDRMQSGSGNIAGSPSLRIDRILKDEFPYGEGPALVLALRSTSLERRPEELADLMFELALRWYEDPLVADVTLERDLIDRRLLPAPGSGHIVLISLIAEDLQSVEPQIPRLRATVEPLLRDAKRRHPDLEWALTGRGALTVDLNRFMAEDSKRAELIALPLLLLILIRAFRSLAAAILPLILAATGMSVTLALLTVTAQWMEISNLVRSVASMVGLAIGIDYSLFLIHRYRKALEARGSRSGESRRGREGRTALAAAMASAGPAVVYSGLTVMIGMGGLLATPIMQTRSIGLAGLVVVGITLAAALTLLPAMLGLIGPNRLEWPRILSARLGRPGSEARWARWADAVTRRPGVATVASLAILALLAAPGLKTRFGLPEGEFLPPELEYTRGMAMLDDMGLRGLLAPVPVILTDAGGGQALRSERVPALIGVSARLRRERCVAFIRGPVDLAEPRSPAQYRALYADVERAMADMPELRSQFVSTDRTRILLWVIPDGDCTFDQVKRLTRRIPALARLPGMTAEAGGQAQYYVDLDHEVAASYPMTLGLVLTASFVALLLLFRAPLVAAKALLLNALSVLAGYGVVVLVFQLGYGSAWLGLPAPTEVVPLTVPLIIFCILFGLSMDYEVFLLSRARAAYRRTGDNRLSIREAVTDTGSVITSAALIMVVVFGAFAMARVVLVQMLGVGLAVAVLVDAALIRTLLGPALMQFAGRWNWWPAGGERRAET